MSTARCCLILAVGILAHLVAACDPGYRYHPVNKEGQTVDPMQQSKDGVIFEMKRLLLFTGQEHCPGSLTVTNQSKEAVVVLGGELETKGKKIKAVISGEDNKSYATIQPNTTDMIQPAWRLGGAASNVLGTDLVYVWQVKIGEKEEAIRFEMRRDK